MKKALSSTLALFLLAIDFLGLAGGITAYGQGLIEFRGTVTDESGAFIVAAPVVIDDGKSNKYSSQTNDQGRYHFAGVKPGVYTLTVEVEGFAKFTQQVDLTSKPSAPFDIELQVFISDEVDVKTDDAGISTEPDKNLSAITLSTRDLEALPDDPDELLDTLRQMAGASGGADDASIYVGGFRERGRIPPKEAIQMVRINVNPFAPEYSEPGNTRIEIITKPGSDTYHGSFRFAFIDEALNARDAFAPVRAPLQIRNYNGNFSGPIIRNRWGFFADVDRRETDENDVVNATILDPVTLQPILFAASVPSPNRIMNFSIRSDFLATKKHTLGLQYRFTDNDWRNLQSGFDLPERAFTRTTREDTLRFSLTSIVTERAVNEIRLQLNRRTLGVQALTDAPAINVLDAFNSGGNQGSLFQDNRTNTLEFSDDLTYTYNKHTIKMGLRSEGVQQKNINRSNFGGTFTFGTDFERDQQGFPVLDENGARISISPLELYRRVLLGEPGYSPSQFSIVRGDPFVGFTQWEIGWYLQDDWRVSDRLTLSYGLRHEFQTHLQDKLNFAPRFGLAWVPDKQKKGTVRAGGGLFYNRLDSGITFDTIRFDGQHQQQFVIARPAFFPDIPDSLSGAVTRKPTIRIKDEELNAPYSMMATVGYERQLPHNIFGSVTYTWQRAVHLLRTRNINVADPQTGPSALPFPDQGPILQFESTGISNRHQLRFTVRAMLNRTFSLFGNYSLSSTRSDTDSAYTTPANSLTLVNEYGRSSMDARHQMFIGGSISLPMGFRINPFINASSGRPFNITTGRDNNNDTQFTDRPSFADPTDPGAIVTEFGTFNPNPLPGEEIIPRNFGDGPGSLSVNVNFSKTFGFGPAQGQQARNQGGNNRNRDGNAGGRMGGGFGGGGMGRGGFGGGGRGGGFFGGDSRNKYNLTFSVNVRNLINHTNPAAFNGVLTSPFFGTANRALEARRIEASLRFSF